ncbi:hypothetical protein FNF27_04729 [Cafeteria roenbergensis]|uniref:Ribonuclease n=1 Tax=Cafeteria roenbergensis TaxID=33653 RepID=A0A5A8DMX0_CAFRO|nr:hypothetical protein FNF28_04315 [Cafeteria roenbergensis]KAA0165330.1 hypothetical protein FNF31_01983 [Cafeteria roenbergensis]KAA0173781.1 hypothetical protein FNF27_04729 [Cafeteria roenbergensis]
MAWLASAHSAAAAASGAEAASLMGMALEDAARAAGWRHVIGVDEAGRGPLCGPVVSAAVMVLPARSGEGGPGDDTSAEPVPGVMDSKTLAEPERERLAEALMAHERVVWAVAAAGPRAIEQHNILRAALDGMTVAADAVLLASEGRSSGGRSSAASAAARGADAGPVWRGSGAKVFVDGNRMPPAFKGRMEQSLAAEQGQNEGEGQGEDKGRCDAFEAETLVKGDSRCYSIAAASVLAKVTRDRIMKELDGKYPGYDMAGHKGYPTPAHMAIVREKGATDSHRLTFAPLKGHWTRDESGKAVPVGSDSDGSASE